MEPGKKLRMLSRRSSFSIRLAARRFDRYTIISSSMLSASSQNITTRFCPSAQEKSIAIYMISGCERLMP